MRIRNLMTTEVVTIGADAPLKEAARLMLEAGISGMPVTDDDSLVGIITEADFVASEAGRRVQQRAGLLRFLHHDHEIPSQDRLVGDVMTKDVKIIDPEEDHAVAARLMEKQGIKRIPVVEDGKLVGVVSRADMLRAYVRPDEDIVNEINKHVMKEILWIDPRRVTVTSLEGNVSLTGKLETKSDASLLVELTKRLDGVTSVQDHLDFEVDNTRLEMVSPPTGYARGNW
ncbi:MAG: CBS domain-containing protein [Actinomycetota bacterium]|nr:CBS domain-containing protein [Actinomycetota bacterium]